LGGDIVDELMEALSYLYQRKGTDVISEKELVLSVSMDLGWFSPNEAKELVRICNELKLLKRTEHGLVPTFDYNSITVPIDLKPSKNILKLESQEPRLLSIVRKIEAESGKKRNIIMAEINKKQVTLNVEIEVAAIIIAKNHGVDISGYLREAEMEIYERAQKGE
jgi:hypothetical protein